MRFLAGTHFTEWRDRGSAALAPAISIYTGRMMTFSEAVTAVLVVACGWATYRITRAVWKWCSLVFKLAVERAASARMADIAQGTVSDLRAERMRREAAERLASDLQNIMNETSQQLDAFAQGLDRLVPVWSQISFDAHTGSGPTPSFENVPFHYDAQEILIDVRRTHAFQEVWIRPQDCVVVHYDNADGEHIFWHLDGASLMYLPVDDDTEMVNVLPAWVVRKMAVDAGETVTFTDAMEYQARVEIVGMGDAYSITARNARYIIWPNMKPEANDPPVPTNKPLHAPATNKPGRVLRNRRPRN